MLPTAAAGHSAARLHCIQVTALPVKSLALVLIRGTTSVAEFHQRIIQGNANNTSVSFPNRCRRSPRNKMYDHILLYISLKTATTMKNLVQLLPVFFSSLSHPEYIIENPGWRTGGKLLSVITGIH